MKIRQIKAWERLWNPLPEINGKWKNIVQNGLEVFKNWEYNLLGMGDHPDQSDKERIS